MRVLHILSVDYHASHVFVVLHTQVRPTSTVPRLKSESGGGVHIMEYILWNTYYGEITGYNEPTQAIFRGALCTQ